MYAYVDVCHHRTSPCRGRCTRPWNGRRGRTRASPRCFGACSPSGGAWTTLPGAGGVGGASRTVPVFGGSDRPGGDREGPRHRGSPRALGRVDQGPRPGASSQRRRACHYRGEPPRARLSRRRGLPDGPPGPLGRPREASAAPHGPAPGCSRRPEVDRAGGETGGEDLSHGRPHARGPAGRGLRGAADRRPPVHHRRLGVEGAKLVDIGSVARLQRVSLTLRMEPWRNLGQRPLGDVGWWGEGPRTLDP